MMTLLTFLSVVVAIVVVTKVIRAGMEVLAFIAKEIERTAKRIVRQAKRSALTFLVELKDTMIELAVTTYFQLIGKLEQ